MIFTPPIIYSHDYLFLLYEGEIVSICRKLICTIENQPPDLLGSTIHVFPVTNFNNIHYQILIFDRVHNPGTPLPNTVLVLARQLLAARRSGIIGELADAVNKALAILSW